MKEPKQSEPKDNFPPGTPPRPVTKEIQDTALIQSFKEGDLLYGLDAVRQPYAQHIDKTIGKGEREVFSTVDRLNKAIGLQLLTKMEEWCESLKDLKEEAPRNYSTYLLEHKKYTPKNDSFIKDKRSLEDQRIVRACKAAVENPKIIIHFCLDKLDLDSVLNLVKEQRKNATGYNSFTSAELRYIFRYWNDLKNRVQFYRDGDVVPAPWIENAQPWEKIKRGNKKKISLIKQTTPEQKTPNFGENPNNFWGGDMLNIEPEKKPKRNLQKEEKESIEKHPKKKLGQDQD